jgi:endonuclease/exonuclease/phosphatase family metal-dependent hydrolase
MLPILDEPAYVPSGIDSAGRALRTHGGWVLGGVTAGVGAAAALPIGVKGGVIAGTAAGLVAAYLRGGRVKPPATEAPVAAPDVAAPEQLRVMEYNVHGGMGGPGQFFATPARLDHLAATIKRENPDIVLLQELDHRATRSNFIDTLGQLAKRLRPTGAVMTPAIEKVNGRREGTGILTFNGAVITEARGLRIGDAVGENAVRRFCATADAWARVATARLGHRWEPFGGVVEYQPRVATDAMVRTAAGNHVRVLSGHFSPPQHGVDEPRRQVDPVVATIRAWRGPTVVGADFNVRDGSPEFRREHEVFDAVGLDEATAGAPANSDRVYASAHFAAADARRLATPVGEAPASDHVPVIVDLTLRAGSGPVAHP